MVPAQLTKALLLFIILCAFVSAQRGKTNPTYQGRRRPTQRASTSSTSQVVLKKNSLTLDVIPQKDYDKTLEGFNLDVIHTLAVNPKDQVEYDFRVDPDAGKFVWISYIVKDEAQYEFVILDRESNSVLYTVTNQPEYMARLRFSKAEDLKLVFRNLAYNSYIRILVGLECHGCNPQKALADKENVRTTLESLKSIDYRRSRMFFMSELYKEKQSVYLRNLKASHQKVYMFSMIEIAAIALINVYQICAIRGLLSKKVVV